nr:hypothetical protein [uncultured Flavobacterium sp.]
MGTFVISTKENGEFKFTYNNRRGKTVLTSPGFKTKEDCYASIENLKTNFLLTSHPKFKSVSEKYFFKIVLNDAVLCTSRKFTTLLRVEKAISDMNLYLLSGEVLDFTEYCFPEIDFDAS